MFTNVSPTESILQSGCSNTALKEERDFSEHGLLLQIFFSFFFFFDELVHLILSYVTADEISSLGYDFFMSKLKMITVR